MDYKISVLLKLKMFLILFSFYLMSVKPDLFSGIPLNLFNSLIFPLVYYDSVNDFSPNYFYRNLQPKVFEPDSEKVISRFLLFRGPLSTEENSITSFLPIFKGYFNTGFSFLIWRNNISSQKFTHHNYYLTIFSNHVPLSFKFFQSDANPESDEMFARKYIFSFHPFNFDFTYLKEINKFSKEKYKLSFENLYENFYYAFSFSYYIFYLQEKRILKNFKASLNFLKIYTEIETGNESREGERYSLLSGLNLGFLDLFLFMEKLLFPLPFDSLREFLGYNEPVRTRGMGLRINFKNENIKINLKIKYLKAKDLLFIEPVNKNMRLYSGNLLSIFTSDTVNCFNFLKFFTNYRLKKGENLTYELWNIGFLFYLLREADKNYFVYLKGNLFSYNENYLYRIGIEGDFYSYLLISFNYSQPAGGNFFYPENISPFSYYTITVKVNIPD